MAIGFRTKNDTGGVQVDADYANYVLCEWGELTANSGSGYYNSHADGFAGEETFAINFTHGYPSTAGGNAPPLLFVKHGNKDDHDNLHQGMTDKEGNILAFHGWISSGSEITGFHLLKTHSTDQEGVDFQWKVYFPADQAVECGAAQPDLGEIDQPGIKVIRADGSTAFDSRLTYMKIIDTIPAIDHGDWNCNGYSWGNTDDTMGIYIDQVVMHSWCEAYHVNKSTHGGNEDFDWDQGIGASGNVNDTGQYFITNFNTSGSNVEQAYSRNFPWYSLSSLGGTPGGRILKEGYDEYGFCHKGHSWFARSGLRFIDYNSIAISSDIYALGEQNNESSYNVPYNSPQRNNEIIIIEADWSDRERGVYGTPNEYNAGHPLQVTNISQPNWNPEVGFHDPGSYDVSTNNTDQDATLLAAHHTDDTKDRVYPIQIDIDWDIGGATAEAIADKDSIEIWERLYWRNNHDEPWSSNSWHVVHTSPSNSDTTGTYRRLFSDIHTNYEFELRYIVRILKNNNEVLWQSEQQYIPRFGAWSGKYDGNLPSNWTHNYSYDYSTPNEWPMGKSEGWVNGKCGPFVGIFEDRAQDSGWLLHGLYVSAIPMIIGPLNPANSTGAPLKNGVDFNVNHADNHAAGDYQIIEFDDGVVGSSNLAADLVGETYWPGYVDLNMKNPFDGSDMLLEDCVVSYRIVPYSLIDFNNIHGGPYKIYGEYAIKGPFKKWLPTGDIEYNDGPNGSGHEFENGTGEFRLVSPFVEGGGDGCGSSDILNKYNIDLVGTSKSGINIYEFEYIDKAYGSGRYRGVMANEVLHACFINSDGKLWVDYNKLDVDFEEC
tara:strand:- start:6989 stop:9466 length:2478 start_codon:yes stop_codon:yes gene_type:complete